jgi:phosphohistidine phosphatase
VKKLVLIRHAKSLRDGTVSRDIDRPLNDRGLRDAPFMAARFAQSLGDEVDLLVISPAKRTTDTAGYFERALGRRVARKSEPGIYEASLGDLIRVVEQLPGEAKCVVMFGHNPGFSMLTEYLSGEWVDMPTCGIALLEMHIRQWNETGKGVASLIDFDYPKKHLV